MASLLIKSFERSSGVNKGVKSVLSADFFAQNTVDVAQALLGKVLAVYCKRTQQVQLVRIVETEAYRADDPASHSANGITKRCSVMFGPPGVAYVYLIYGMYSMLNFVTEPIGQPGAVLIRGVQPLEDGSSQLPTRGPASGPGRLTRYLKITRSDNGASLNGPRFCVFQDQFVPGRVLCSGRVGISKGKDRFWRFFLEDNPHVSSVLENRFARRLKSIG